MNIPDRPASAVPRRLLVTVAMSTLLNPLNSSMIAVALVPIQAAFHTTVADATWLISAFYLAGAVGQPLMGRLADQFGPRRVFVAGLIIAGVTGAVAPLTPSIAWLAAVRGLQAVGTAAAYPCGMAMIRARMSGGRSSAGSLAVLSIAGNVSAAVGPTIGGALVQAAGWQAIFLVNVPAAVLDIGLALRFLPADPALAVAAGTAGWGRARTVAGSLDLPGVALFGAAIGGLLAFLLSLSGSPAWALLPVAPVAAAALVWWELRAQAPFLNVRMLAPRRGLAGVYVQFATVNLVFYSIFFGLPLWLERVRDVSPGEAGLLVMPFAGLGVLATIAASETIRRWGARITLAGGAAVLCVGIALLIGLESSTPLGAVVGIVAVLGLPNGLMNLALQALLFQTAAGAEMGAASGLFQTCRFVGSVLATSLLGVAFARGVSTAGLHSLAIGLAAVCALVLAMSALRFVRGRGGAAVASSRPDPEAPGAR